MGTNYENITQQVYDFFVFGFFFHTAYLLALVFSTSLAQLDDKISLYKAIPSLWYVHFYETL